MNHSDGRDYGIERRKDRGVSLWSSIGSFGKIWGNEQTLLIGLELLGKNWLGTQGFLPKYRLAQHVPVVSEELAKRKVSEISSSVLGLGSAGFETRTLL